MMVASRLAPPYTDEEYAEFMREAYEAAKPTSEEPLQRLTREFFLKNSVDIARQYDFQFRLLALDSIKRRITVVAWLQATILGYLIYRFGF
jgi:hypothetical protein